MFFLAIAAILSTGAAFATEETRLWHIKAIDADGKLYDVKAIPPARGR